MSNLMNERKEFEGLGMIYPAESDVKVEPATIADVKIYWFTPPTVISDVVIVYLHGGGFIYGSIQSHRAMLSHFAKEFGHKILFVEYSLAPEKPFPGALNETVEVIRESTTTYPDFKFVLMGDSAGGNLVMSTALKLKSMSLASALGQVAISPWLIWSKNIPATLKMKNGIPLFQKNLFSMLRHCTMHQKRNLLLRHQYWETLKDLDRH